MVKLMYFVSLSGLPHSFSFGNIIKILKDLKKEGIVYWVRKYKFDPLNSHPEIIIEIYSKRDAQRAVELLTGKKIKSLDNQDTYSITAIIESSCDIRFSENPRSVKNISTHLSTGPQPKSNMPQRLCEDSLKLSKCPRIPKFDHSTKILIDEMDCYIQKHCHKQKEIFQKVFSGEIRVRLSQLFEGQFIKDVYCIPGPDVVKMYRKIYSENTDEHFVMDVYGMLRTACWPSKEVMQNGMHYLEEFDSSDEETMNVDTSNESDNTMPNKDGLRVEENQEPTESIQKVLDEESNYNLGSDDEIDWNASNIQVIAVEE